MYIFCCYSIFCFLVLGPGSCLSDQPLRRYDTKIFHLTFSISFAPHSPPLVVVLPTGENTLLNEKSEIHFDRQRRKEKKKKTKKRGGELLITEGSIPSRNLNKINWRKEKEKKGGGGGEEQSIMKNVAYLLQRSGDQEGQSSQETQSNTKKESQ